MTHMGELDVKLPLGLLLDADLIKPDWEIWRNHSGEISCTLPEIVSFTLHYPFIGLQSTMGCLELNRCQLNETVEPILRELPT